MLLLSDCALFIECMGSRRALPSVQVAGKHQPCNNPAPMFAKNGTTFVGCNGDITASVGAFG